MRTLTILTVLILTFAPATYVRRQARPTGAIVQVVEGSRDRRLHGKARRHARRAA